MPAPTASAVPSAGPATWLPAGDLLEGRSQTHVALLGTGRVLVVGADLVCTAATEGSDSVELGDPATASWERAASLRSPRERPALVALPDGRALLTGGETGESGGPAAYSSTYVFEPSDGSWSRSGLLNTARTAAVAAPIPDGRVLVVGGLFIDAGQSPRRLDSAELWDPASGTWSTTGKLARARSGATAATLADGRVLVVGGIVAGDEPAADAEIYDPRSGRWSPAGRLAQPRAGFSLAALADGGALMVGGLVPFDAGDFGIFQEPTTTTERFDGSAGSWSPAGAASIAAFDRTAVTLADGRVLVAGGDITINEPDLDETPPALSAVAELFDPTAGTWSLTAPLPRPRSGAAGLQLPDGSVLLIGGDAAPGAPDDAPSCPAPDVRVWRYVPGS